MSKRKRLLSVAVIAIAAFGIYGIGKLNIPISEKKVAEEAEQEEDAALSVQKDTLYFWYTDEAMTDYLNSAAVSFNESKEDVRVVPVLKAGREYIEAINEASVQDEELPDLYIIGNDSLEKAYLAGFADEIETPASFDAGSLFPQVAIDAVTYQDKIVGYPMSYVTSSLIYNKTYLENWLVAKIEAEADAAAGEEAQAAADTSTDAEKAEAEENQETTASEPEAPVLTEEELETLVTETLPANVEALLTIADEYDAPEQVEGVFKWNVNDIFYNYFFVGDAISVGGVCGDNEEDIDLYNEHSIEGLLAYKNLNQFFSIDTEEVSYQGVVQDFIDGKIVFTIAKQDALALIEAAKAEDKFPYEYGVCLLPDVNEDIGARSLSVTNAVAVNSYSVHKTEANEFAAFLVTQDGETLYNRTGKVSALSNVNYENKALDSFMEEYKRSEPIAKMIRTSNYWLKLENAFSKIWNGENANAILKQLSEEIMEQVTGEAYTEEYIPVEEVVEEQEEEEIVSEDSGTEN